MRKTFIGKETIRIAIISAKEQKNIKAKEKPINHKVNHKARFIVFSCEDKVRTNQKLPQKYVVVKFARPMGRFSNRGVV